MENKKLILAKRPNGMPSADTWSLRTEPVGQPQEGEIIIKNEFISLDPAMRGWMDDRPSYIAPVKLGAVMRAGSIGTVIASNNHPKFKEGDVVVGTGGVQTHHKTNGKGYFKVDTNLAPIEKYLGVLGMPGMTAYFGIMDVGKIKSGDVVLVSGAAGAVGSVVGQIAKAYGCTAIGIAGGPDKCQYVTSTLGFDACIDYKNDNVYKALKSVAPKGIDVYFDNVGGEILEIALYQIRKNARIVICGAISQYNSLESITGPKNYLSLLVNSASMQGFVVFDYADRYQEGAMEIAKLIMAGKVKSEETIVEGIDNFYTAFQKLFSGEKRGKLLLKV